MLIYINKTTKRYKQMRNSSKWNCKRHYDTDVYREK